MPELEQKWYAVNDADGNNYVASIYKITDNYVIIPAYYGDDVTDQHPIYLKFEREYTEDQFGKLIVVFFVDNDGAIRGTLVDDLTVPGEHEIILIGKGKYVRIAAKTITVRTELIGDANLDGSVDALDAAEVQKFTAEMVDFSDCQKYLADVNDDGVIDILDAAEIQMYVAGKITEFKKKA